eukprot:2891227-Ditylum_brightwellii.AAC.1
METTVGVMPTSPQSVGRIGGVATSTQGPSTLTASVMVHSRTGVSVSSLHRGWIPSPVTILLVARMIFINSKTIH